MPEGHVVPAMVKFFSWFQKANQAKILKDAILEEKKKPHFINVLKNTHFRLLIFSLILKPFF